MKPLNVIYWLRACLGIASAAICATLGLIWNIGFLDGISVSVLVYIITNYVIKRRFTAEVKETSGMFSIGIGAYFLLWIVFWVLLYSILNPAG